MVKAALINILILRTTQMRVAHSNEPTEIQLCSPPQYYTALSGRSYIYMLPNCNSKYVVERQTLVYR